MSYTLTDAGLVTSDPVIAAIFFDVDPSDNSGLAEISYESDGIVGACIFGTNDAEGMLIENENILIPYPVLREKIKPLEGEIQAYEHFCMRDESAITLVSDADLDIEDLEFDNFYNWRVVIICQTVGELRELIRKCEA